MDISLKSDLMVSVINLIGMEEHAHFSWIMTHDDKWLNVKKETAEIRKRQMADLEKEEDSQLHCFLKHVLSSIVRSWEVGDKLLRDEKIEEAKKYFIDSEKLTEIFYLMNLSEDKKPKSYFQQLKEKYVNKS